MGVGGWAQVQFRVLSWHMLIKKGAPVSAFHSALIRGRCRGSPRTGLVAITTYMPLSGASPETLVLGVTEPQPLLWPREGTAGSG